MQRHTLTLVPGVYAAFRLPPHPPGQPSASLLPPREASPPGSYVFTAISPEETTIIARMDLALSPAHLGPLRLLRLEGVFDISATGVIVSLCEPLASAGCFVLVQSAFSTDYLLVRVDQLETACAALRGAGHRVLGHA